MKGLIIKSQGEIINANLPIIGEVTLYQGKQFGNGHIIWGSEGIEFDTNMTCYSDSAMTTAVAPQRNTRFYTNPNDAEGKYFKIIHAELMNNLEMGNFYIKDIDLVFLPTTINMSNFQISVSDALSLKYIDIFTGTFNGNLTLQDFNENVNIPQLNFINNSDKLRLNNCQSSMRFFENILATELTLSESAILTDAERVAKMENLKVVYAGGAGGQATAFTWSSQTLRDAELPFIAIPYGTYFVTSTDIDNYLINMAACVLPASSTSATMRTINLTGPAGRTAASDAAVATLKAASISITINNTPQ